MILNFKLQWKFGEAKSKYPQITSKYFSCPYVLQLCGQKVLGIKEVRQLNFLLKPEDQCNVENDDENIDKNDRAIVSIFEQLYSRHKLSILLTLSNLILTTILW